MWVPIDSLVLRNMLENERKRERERNDRIPMRIYESLDRVEIGRTTDQEGRVSAFGMARDRRERRGWWVSGVLEPESGKTEEAVEEKRRVERVRPGNSRSDIKFRTLKHFSIDPRF